ncbi:bifunctional DNA primase/polymerase [Nocardia sp. NPDC057663]|uniref:bifunctional DNA primase/polymerase n=1 Tax=Nocardia sp. NPDC057663 TaxID=3346201 RepID=UPI003670ED71
MRTNKPAGAPLHIPDRLAEVCAIDAALAYAEAGWYVLPVKAGTKNPGSLVGGWATQSTRDGETIRGWWAKWPTAGIALHVGRSGAIVFDLDVDNINDVPVTFRNPLQQGVFQSTREVGDRGHYLFAVGAGDHFGNAAGAFASFGEVRGKNGVILAEPSVHPDAKAKGGRYYWPSPGNLPPLPAALRACLRAAGDEAPSMSFAELEQFYAAHSAYGRPQALDGVVRVLETDLSGGMARHDAARNALAMAFREAAAGCYSARDAADRIEAVFVAAFGADKAGRVRPESGEFARAARWAAAQAGLVAPAETLARLDRDDPSLRAIDEESFWAARPELDHLRRFARARRVSPWAMFGAVLARVVFTVPPRVVLPPLVGGAASLNLFVALVGPSGNGKGAAERAAADAVSLGTAVYEATPGSGEGIPKQYAYKSKGEQVNVRDSVLFSVAEIDTLSALAGRSSSTLMPELRKAWMGERLGFGYATVDKAVPIMGHRYRMCLVAGVQPERAQFLLDDADGGTPQRFLWFPTTDADAPDCPPEEPQPWSIPAWCFGEERPALDTGTGSQPAETPGQGPRVKFGGGELLLELPVDARRLVKLKVPPEAAEQTDRARLARLRGTAASELDGHAQLARLKVAAALMALAGRTDKVSDEDWHLSEIVMAVSDRERSRVLQVLGARAEQVNRSRGRAEGEREIARAGVVEENKLDRAVTNLRRHLAKKQRLTRKDARAAFRADLRDLIDEAADRLIAANLAEKEEGQQGSYTLVWSGD